MRLLLINRRVALLNRRAVTSDGGAPCCCGGNPQRLCACQGFWLFSGCGAGAALTCCKVPTNYDLEIVGGHRYESSATGSLVGTNVTCTAPGPVHLEEIAYRLVVKVRCVDGRETYDYTGSTLNIHVRNWISAVVSGTPQYDDTRIDRTDEAAWTEFRTGRGGSTVGNNSPGFDEGVMNRPSAFGMFADTRTFRRLSFEGADPLTYCRGRNEIPLTPGINCSFLVNRQETNSYVWDAASTCTEGHFTANGSGFTQTTPNTGSGVVEERALITENVTWRRNDNVVEQAACGDVPVCSATPTTGACCLPGDPFGFSRPCITTSAADCARLGGQYAGDGTNCTSIICTPLGGCCLPTGACVNTTAGLCALRGGTYLGNGNPCGNGPCAVTGACCLPGGCVDMTGAACELAGGVYLGDNTTCATSSPCVTPPNKGSCCLPDGTCIDTDQASCALKGGIFATNTPCTARTCFRTTVPDRGPIFLPEPSAGALLDALV